MPIYEHVSGERQLTAEGSLMDTELGVKALDPASGWRRVEPPPEAEPASRDELEPDLDVDLPSLGEATGQRRMRIGPTPAQDDAADPPPSTEDDTTTAAVRRATTRS